MRTMTWEAVLGRRLARHALMDAVPAQEMPALVGRVGGIHAQVMSAAEISIGMRARGVTRRDIAEALWGTRRLVKTYGPRGTVHLLPAADLAIYGGALSHVSEETRMRERQRVGLEPDQIREMVDAVGESLRGTALTKGELGDAVVRRVGEWARAPTVPSFGGFEPRWRAALGYAAYDLQLCFGPPRKNQVTFVHPADWVGAVPRQDTDACLSDVLMRYLSAYGPSTGQAFARWFGCSAAQGAALFDRSRESLVPVSVDDWEGYLPREDAGDLDAGGPGGVKLLPYFDVYGVGGFPRERVFGDVGALRALKHGGAGVLPLLIVDGVVAGIWHHRRQGRRVLVTVDPFHSLDPGDVHLLRAEVARLGEILESQVEWQFGAVGVVPHL